MERGREGGRERREREGDREEDRERKRGEGEGFSSTPASRYDLDMTLCRLA